MSQGDPPSAPAVTDDCELSRLPNLGRTTVMWLRAVGIRDTDSLRERGAPEAYLAMRRRGFRVTNAVLYSLAGALSGRPWRDFANSEKASLRKAVAEAAALQPPPADSERRPPARAQRRPAPGVRQRNR